MKRFLKTDCEGFHRRDFMKIGTAGLAGLSLPHVLRLEAQARERRRGAAASPPATSVILVWLAGGPATIDMWDIKTEAPENIRGPFRPISSSVSGIQISEHLPRMARIADKYTIVRSLAHTIPSHSPATVFMTTGNRPTPAVQYPALGSLVTRLTETPRSIPPYVSFRRLRNGQAGGGGYLGTAYNPFVVEGSARRGRSSTLQVRGITLPTGFTLEQLENRDGLLRNFDRGFQALDRNSDLADGLDSFHRQALEILRSDATRNAFALDRESTETRNRYGTDSFGQSALAARRLIQAGVRFVTISTGSWDTHNQNFDRLRTRNLPPLDRTLSALIEDLDNRGMLDNTIVYCAGEFGRTPRINRRTGRDHWSRSMAVVLAGGGLRRGYAHGRTDTNGMAPAENRCTPDDIAATIVNQLGINPHQELMTPTGRPIALFREGNVIRQLVG